MKSLHHIASLSIALVSVVFIAAFSFLAQAFDYPNILRQPPSTILALYSQRQSEILPAWWSMMIAALLFIPTSGLVARRVGASGTGLQLGVWFGGMAGLVQAIGLSRWVFLVPSLASAHQNPSTRSSAEQLFTLFHGWLGAGIGEWFGYLFTSAWTVVVVTNLFPRKPWLAAIGGISSIGILIGLLEPFGHAEAGPINAIAYSVWSIWLIAVAFVQLSPRPSNSGH
jgi:hypothetical protein